MIIRLRVSHEFCSICNEGCWLLMMMQMKTKHEKKHWNIKTKKVKNISSDSKVSSICFYLNFLFYFFNLFLVWMFFSRLHCVKHVSRNAPEKREKNDFVLHDALVKFREKIQRLFSICTWKQRMALTETDIQNLKKNGEKSRQTHTSKTTRLDTVDIFGYLSCMNIYHMPMLNSIFIAWRLFILHLFSNIVFPHTHSQCFRWLRLHIDVMVLLFNWSNHYNQLDQSNFHAFSLKFLSFSQKLNYYLLH